MRRAWPTTMIVAFAMLVGACVSADSEPSAPSAGPERAEPSSDPAAPRADLDVECAGVGSPTVVLIAGLDNSARTFGALQDSLAEISHTCWIDRAGIGDSRILASDAPNPSPGSAAADLRATLAAQGVAPPYVMLGWSYGGMVAQAYAAAFGEDLDGLVFEDSSVLAQLIDPDLFGIGEDEARSAAEGGRKLDQEAAKEQLAHLDFGDVPLVVVSQDDVQGSFRRVWYRHHDELARRSSDGVHVVAVDAGHFIHHDALDLMVAILEAVVVAARTGSPLGACDDRFIAAGGRCRAT